MRTIVIHPDMIEGGWDLIDADIISVNQSFARRQGVELPAHLPGRWGEFLRAAEGGKNLQEISKIMNISPRRAGQLLQEMLQNPSKLVEKIAEAKNALFTFPINDLPRPKKSRRGRRVGKKTPPPQGVEQHELFPGGEI